MYSHRRIRWAVMGAIVLGLCVTIPTLAQRPADQSPPKLHAFILLAGGECINCVEQQGENRCDVQCVMPLAAILTNSSDHAITVRLMLSVNFGKDALKCGNADQSQLGTYTLAAHSTLRIGFGHTFIGEFSGAVFTATAWVLPQPQWGGASTEREMVFDAAVPLCSGGEE